jgi:hypothetical protein
MEDIWLCAYVAEVVPRQLDEEAIPVENWEQKRRSFNWSVRCWTKSKT